MTQPGLGLHHAVAVTALKYVFGVQESGSGTFLRAPLHGIVPAGVVDLPRVTLRTASGKKEPDPGPLNTYLSCRLKTEGMTSTGSVQESPRLVKRQS